MFSHSHESRRGFLRAAAAFALVPVVARAGCPCDVLADDAADRKPPATQPSNVLSVCADPNDLPYSNRKHEGFEDKIAQLVADELKLPIHYDWLPQRLGFYRTALKTFDARLVMAAPANFDKALITRPYYRSSYVFVYRKDMEDAPSSFDDAVLKSAKIGVQLTGANTPATHALAKRKLIDNVTGYPVFDETDGKPAGRIVSAVASGEVDIAIVWGPQAGWCARQEKVALEVKPISPQIDGSGDEAMPFTFEICMAVRRSEPELRDRINTVIQSKQSQIDKILDDYFVPRLPIESAKKDKA